MKCGLIVVEADKKKKKKKHTVPSIRKGSGVCSRRGGVRIFGGSGVKNER